MYFRKNSAKNYATGTFSWHFEGPEEKIMIRIRIRNPEVRICGSGLRIRITKTLQIRNTDC
jgi:hypothetical protein